MKIYSRNSERPKVGEFWLGVEPLAFENHKLGDTWSHRHTTLTEEFRRLSENK